MTINTLLSTEWFAYLVIIFLVVMTLKNGWQLIIMLLTAWANSD